MKAFTAEDLRRKASAQLALKSIRQGTRKTGRDRLTIAQIDRGIAASRKARSRGADKKLA